MSRFLLYNVQLVGSNVQRVNVRRQPHIRLLRSIGPNQGVDLDAVDIVHFLQSSPDLRLGRSWVRSASFTLHITEYELDVDDEDQGIVLLNLLHRAFGVERKQEDARRVQARLFLSLMSASHRP